MKFKLAKRIVLRTLQVVGMIATFFVAITASGAAIDPSLSWGWRFVAFSIMLLFMAIFIAICSAEIP